MENINVILANNIQNLRKKTGMTQDELANILGVTFQAVSKWENEKSAPDISLLPLIADTFSCSIDALFSHKAENNDKKAASEHNLIDWEDDGVIRGVVFDGRKIVKSQKLLEKFTFEIEGDTKAVSCGCNLHVNGSVSGGCNAGRELIVSGNLSGGCNAGRELAVGGNISGGCNAGREISVGGSLTGNANAREITATTIKAEKLTGDVVCEKIECDNIKGNVTIVQKKE